MGLYVNVDNKTIQRDSDGKISLKLSSQQNQGLQFDENGKLMFVGSGLTPSSSINTPGNGIGKPSDPDTEPLYTIGMNSTVSRHQSYTGTNQNIKDNDGVVMSQVTNGNITGGLAYFIINS